MLKAAIREVTPRYPLTKRVACLLGGTVEDGAVRRHLLALKLLISKVGDGGAVLFIVPESEADAFDSLAYDLRLHAGTVGTQIVFISCKAVTSETLARFHQVSIDQIEQDPGCNWLDQ